MPMLGDNCGNIWTEDFKSVKRILLIGLYYFKGDNFCNLWTICDIKLTRFHDGGVSHMYITLFNIYAPLYLL
jgi:hypothetical protein